MDWKERSQTTVVEGCGSCVSVVVIVTKSFVQLVMHAMRLLKLPERTLKSMDSSYLLLLAHSRMERLLLVLVSG